VPDATFEQPPLPKPSGAPPPILSVVVPTYNESANIGPLLQALDAAFAGTAVEYVVVDDDSKDGTAGLARAASPRARVIVRKGERGLATAVVRGMAESRGTYVAVMDADFQHPPEAVRALLERARGSGADLVIGSRYATGGSEGGFAASRKLMSRGARGIARLALPAVRRFHVTDPMSGLFLVRRDRIDAASLRPKGYKILLEVLARGDLRDVQEVGYRFDNRRGGDSKLGANVMAQYLAHVAALSVTQKENQRLVRFLLVGASGVLVTLGLAWLLHALAGWEESVAVLAATEGAILWNFLLNDTLTFRDRRERTPWIGRLALFNVVSLAAVTVNFAVFFVLHYFLDLHYLVAEAVAILVAFTVNYFGNLRFTYAGARRPTLRKWLPILILVVAASGFYFSELNEPDSIYFDESYYLAVAHQMDNGVWNDPCWQDAMPLNYEHPPLAKLILYASVHAYDTYHGVFLGCRAPDTTGSQANVPTPCYPNSTLETGKDCFSKWVEDMRTQGNPYAWRGPSALFGVITVAFAALAARRLFASDGAGVLAGAFVLADDLVLSTSRIALLDIFAVGFAVMACWAATHPTRKGIVGTAAFLGLGFSCKYYVLFVGPPIALLSLWTHWRAGRLTKTRFDWHWISYLTVPPAVWLATYTPWWIVWTRAKGVGFAVGTFLKVQVAALQWDSGLGVNGDQGHQYQSKPLEWLPMMKPMSYIGPSNPQPDTVGAYVYAVGNPILWWAAALAVLYALIDYVSEYAGAMLRGRRTRVPSPISFFASLPRIKQALLVASLLPLIGYAGFFLLHRTTFIFYMTLVVPFFAIVLAGAAIYLWHSPGRMSKALTIALCAAVVLGFLWYFQVSIYMPIPRNNSLADVLAGHNWQPIPGTPLDYPAPGFNDVMHTVPWMHPFGSWDCWQQGVSAANCT